MQEELAGLFAFESDFAGSLRCVPMAVRFKLDVVGVKIGLRDWARFGQDERDELLRFPFARPHDMEQFRLRVCALVQAHSGVEPGTLPFDDPPVWEITHRVPGDLHTHASRLGVDLPPERWASLSPLRRFALVKLSRPKHDNVNFLPALREFDVTP